MREYTLEVCVDSIESAIAAQAGGATRLELCSNLIIGGTTPGPSLFKQIRNYVTIPVHVLIRPRYGDFCYSDYEHQVIKDEICLFKELGAEGVVFGSLLKEGTLDVVKMMELMHAAAGMSTTLHRAIDMCKNPFSAMEEAITLGFETILTSGQKDNCLEGINVLAKMVEQSEGRICIQIGSGVNANVIPHLYEYTNATAYHMSGKIIEDSIMEYRKADVNMGLSVLSEYSIFRTSEKSIMEAKNILEKL